MARETGQDQDNDAVMLGILSALEADPRVSQRHVASDVGIALGLVNGYLKRCVKKGYVKVSQAPARRYAYYLTPKGLSEKARLTASYLSHSFSFFRRARAECADIFAVAASRGHGRLLVIGEGDLSDVARLVATEHAIEIIGVVPNLLATRRSVGCDAVDAALVADLVDPAAMHAAAVAVFGADRVYAPALLRVAKLRATKGH